MKRQIGLVLFIIVGLLVFTTFSWADQYVPEEIEQAALAEMEYEQPTALTASAETEKQYCLLNNNIYFVKTNWGRLGFHFTDSLKVTKQMILCQQNKKGKKIFTPWINGPRMSEKDELAVKALWDKEGGIFSCQDGVNKAARYRDGSFAYKTATPTGKVPEFEVPLQ